MSDFYKKLEYFADNVCPNNSDCDGCKKYYIKQLCRHPKRPTEKVSYVRVSMNEKPRGI